MTERIGDIWNQFKNERQFLNSVVEDYRSVLPPLAEIEPVLKRPLKVARERELAAIRRFTLTKYILPGNINVEAEEVIARFQTLRQKVALKTEQPKTLV